MSVIVMGRELPTGYDDCWYLRCEFWRNCAIDGKQYNCPLRQLPEKHGRLGDIDAIMEEIKNSRIFKGDYLIALMDIVGGARTIVEAEGE